MQRTAIADISVDAPLDGENQERLQALVIAARKVLHDINNAITPVSLDTEVMLTDEPNLSQPMREYLENVQHAIDDIAAAIARVQTVKTERGTAPVPAAANIVARPLGIVLVDDDASILDSMRTVLELDGHHVIGAASGAAAVEAFKVAQYAGTRIDVVITDLSMPNMDGWQVARAMKALRPQVQVILLTGWSHLTSDDNMPEVDHMLAKPARIADLQDALVHCAARLDAAAANESG